MGCVLPAGVCVHLGVNCPVFCLFLLDLSDRDVVVCKRIVILRFIMTENRQQKI